MENNVYLDKLKIKCNLDDKFIENIEELFDKLVEFGYISRSNVKRLSKRLLSNIDLVIFGNIENMDYKSGYYDAVKKELYIKDADNIESVYLRLLYAMTTINVGVEEYSVGYSTEILSKTDYKIKHENFGINRAVISNLVCRLLYTLPTTLSIMPTYRTYENNFLGYKVSADNDIYFLEGKLLSQVCYVLGINEENLYYNIFTSSPVKYMTSTFNRTDFKSGTRLIEILDSISRKYSNYNKLCYLNKLLNDNFVNIKKHILSENIDELEKENFRIRHAINNTLSRLHLINLNEEIEKDDEDVEASVESSLSEKINIFEEEIIALISDLQDILISNLISHKEKHLPIEYVTKLKKLEQLLVINNDKLANEIYSTISEKLLIGSEHTSINLIEKIKYSLIQEIITSDKFSGIKRSLTFKRIIDLDEDFDNTAYITLNIDNSFVELAEVDNLKNPMKVLKNNTRIITIDNLKHLLNSDISNSNSSRIELIFSTVKKEHDRFKSVPLESMYICKVKDIELVLILQNNNISVLKLYYKNGELATKLLTISDSYYVYGNSSLGGLNSSLPTLYKEKPKLFRRFLMLLFS